MGEGEGEKSLIRWGKEGCKFWVGEGGRERGREGRLDVLKEGKKEERREVWRY